MSDETADADRHAMKMAKKKAARDKIMATKTDKKGLIIVHTGKGTIHQRWDEYRRAGFDSG